MNVSSDSHRLNIDLETGLIRGVRQCPSPNFNDRPDSMAVELIVVHSISLPEGVYGGNEVEDFFCNHLDCDAHSSFDELRELHVSAHLFIQRTGKITQFVSLNKRAWHAGVSNYDGRSNVNDFSIGIELEGWDNDGFEDAQYKSLNDLINLFTDRIPTLDRSRIVGHSDIAPSRKTDPGPYFDWSRVR